ncbi:MAG TPA: ABC transporter substrate-binding protein, partial [Candidatus Omnitrophota bacterium]|nr:ABC transporter substrate-binding protein [Candidatus Omnitrophota bacterium]
AVMAGRFSPVVIEVSPIAQEKGIILLDPWASADGIIDDRRKPNWVFRLSLRDEFAMPAMLAHARSQGIRKVGLLLANTAWGRSNLASAERAGGRFPDIQVVGKAWFNWGETSLLPQYKHLVAQGAKAILFVTNDVEGALLVREMAALPPAERVPLFFHWGITGGTFVEQTQGALTAIDHAVVQTFSFAKADPAMVERVMATTGPLFGLSRPDQIEAPVGFAHAYDLTHILAKAIALAGSTDRAQVRDALEKVRDHKGLVRFFPQPFTPSRHEALGPDEVFLARFRADGALVPLGR